jgi:hypothetical protein
MPAIVTSSCFATRIEKSAQAQVNALGPEDKEPWRSPLSETGDAAVSGYGRDVLEASGRGLSEAGGRAPL